MHRSHSHSDLRATAMHYYHVFMRFSRKYFWFFVAWKIVSFFLFARFVAPLFSSGGAVAYVTLVATPDYAEPACVSAFTLFNTGTKHPVIALVPRAYFSDLQPRLRHSFNEVLAVDPITNPNHGASLQRPEYAQTYTKLQVWGLTQYTRIIFFDSDVVFLQNLDELFDRPAAPLYAVEECCSLFNSGIMLLAPSRSMLNEMISKIPTLPSFDGGDAGFLNSFFTKWEHLPWEYNAQQTIYISPAFRRQWEVQSPRLKVLHYMGEKPWKVLNSTYSALHKPWHDANKKMLQSLRE